MHRAIARILKMQRSLSVAVYKSWRKVHLALREIVAKTSIVSWMPAKKRKFSKYDMFYLIIFLKLDIVLKYDHRNIVSFLKLHSFMKNIAFWKLKIIQKWLQKWCKDYRISLKYPSKPFSKTQEVQKRKITQILKSVWTARYLWKAKYKVDLPIFFSWSNLASS